MHVIIPFNLRSILATFAGLIIVFAILIKKESKNKSDYEQRQGKVTFEGKQHGNLPNRDFGKYRYTIIDTYQYPFELFSEETTIAVDSLKVGDIVKAYFYNDPSTAQEGVNRHLMYLDKDGREIYKAGTFLRTIAYWMIGFILICMSYSYILYKKGKISY